MKNNLLYRIIGAFSSALIILSVFMAFSTIENTSVWDLYSEANMIYMPIMIIVFGSIGVIFFSLNIKTEFAYATSGAIIFFTVMQLVQSITNDTTSMLGMGFYSAAIGGVMTGIMAFICNLRVKNDKTIPVQSSNDVEMAYSNIMVNPEAELKTPTNNNIFEDATQEKISPEIIEERPLVDNNQVVPNLIPVEPSIVNNEYQSIPDVMQEVNSSKPEVILGSPNPEETIDQNINMNNWNLNVNQQINSEVQQTEPVVNNEVYNTEPVGFNPATSDLINNLPRENDTLDYTVNTDSSNTNMQNLDIFGNFK